MADPLSQDELESLSAHLAALAHPRRLELLALLRIPRAAREIELRPWKQGLTGNLDRAISRSAVERHLQTLESIGVVARRPAERQGKRVEEYGLDHARLFAVLEGLRELSRLRPLIEFASGTTLEARGSGREAEARPLPAGRFVVRISGPREGDIIPLDGQGPWRIGRAPGVDVGMGHDPFVSGVHAAFETTEEGRLRVRDIMGNRNGTAVNWAPLPRGGALPLTTGDVVGVGRSLLLYRDGRRVKD